MYLSDRDLKRAIEDGHLIVEPKPTKIDPTSIDLRLDSPDQAKIWDCQRYAQDNAASGHPLNELRIGRFQYAQFGPKYLVAVPPPSTTKETPLVFRRGDEIVIRPGGFLLWQTKETVGTPENDAGLICFVDGKSTRARTGIVVHLTAPTIHASWSGHITLEIANFGPFDFTLFEDDVIAQLTVARISSPPEMTMQKAGSVTYGQANVAAGTKP